MPHIMNDKDKLMVRILQNKWEEIGYDVLQANSCLSTNGQVKDMPRSHVIDVVVDHVVGGCWCNSAEEREAINYFAQLPRTGQARRAIYAEAFPYKSYGL